MRKIAIWLLDRTHKILDKDEVSIYHACLAFIYSAIAVTICGLFNINEEYTDDTK